MLQTEFIKNLNCNYNRVLLEQKPEERRYQYCMLARGGIKGLLDCSLRYLNGQAYLYYDITSKQSVEQFFMKKTVTREWMTDFMWSFQRIRQELERFLLEERNIIWYPEQIFQDLEQKVFYFLYMPYHEGENGFHQLLEFLVEHINYEDEALVECVYRFYERYEQSGDTYLQGQIFEDAKVLERGTPSEPSPQISLGETDKAGRPFPDEAKKGGLFSTVEAETVGRISPEGARKDERVPREASGSEANSESGSAVMTPQGNEAQEKRGLFSFWESRKRRGREQQDFDWQGGQCPAAGRAVAEEAVYGGSVWEEADYGRTVYIPEPEEKKPITRRLYTPEGKIAAMLDRDCLTIGKKKGEADLVLEDPSVSRIHARITREDELYYLEDMNSTNGTSKNGLELQPYEKRRLEEGDEIRLGSAELVFR